MNNLSPILTPLCRFLTPSDHHLSTNQDVLFLSLMNISFWVSDFEGLQMCWGKGPGTTDMHLWELDSPLWVVLGNLGCQASPSLWPKLDTPDTDAWSSTFPILLGTTLKRASRAGISAFLLWSFLQPLAN